MKDEVESNVILISVAKTLLEFAFVDSNSNDSTSALKRWSCLYLGLQSATQACKERLKECPVWVEPLHAAAGRFHNMFVRLGSDEIKALASTGGMEAAYKVIKDMAPYFPKQLQALSNVTAAHSTIKSLTEVPQATQDYTELANIVKNAVTVRSLDTQALMFLEPELSKGAERYQKAACDNLRSVLNSVQDEAAQVSKKLEKYRCRGQCKLFFNLCGSSPGGLFLLGRT